MEFSESALDELAVLADKLEHTGASDDAGRIRALIEVSRRPAEYLNPGLTRVRAVFSPDSDRGRPASRDYLMTGGVGYTWGMAANLFFEQSSSGDLFLELTFALDYDPIEWRAALWGTTIARGVAWPGGQSGLVRCSSWTAINPGIGVVDVQIDTRGVAS